MSDLTTAKRILSEHKEYTCVLCMGEAVYTSTERGVKPLVDLVKSGKNTVGFSAADKVIGRATAFLYLLLKVKAVYAGVVSRVALDIFEKFGIPCEYDVVAENIINRKGDGICPFELATLDVTEPKKAFEIICERMHN